MQIRGLRPVLQDVVRDSAGIEFGAPGSDGLVQDLVRQIEPHAQRAMRFSSGGYNKRWASAVEAAQAALARDDRALSAFKLFCSRILSSIDSP